MKRILPILVIVLLFTAKSQGQTTRTSPDADRVVKLYPNPATSNIITFEVQKNFVKGLSIQVYNFLGKKMYENLNASEKTTIDLSEFNRGVYIYHLRDQGGKLVESGKFQVSR